MEGERGKATPGWAHEVRRARQAEPAHCDEDPTMPVSIATNRKVFNRPSLTMFGSMKLLTQGRAGSGTDFSSMQMRMM